VTGLGGRAHQALIESVVAHYAGDDRIRAVVVFGSVGVGNWHELSDVDLDVVIEDGAQVEPAAEIATLFGPRAVIVLTGTADRAAPDEQRLLDAIVRDAIGAQKALARRAYPPAARNAAPISARAAPPASSTCSSSRALTGSRKPALIRPWPSRSRSEPGKP